MLEITLVMDPSNMQVYMPYMQLLSIHAVHSTNGPFLSTKFTEKRFCTLYFVQNYLFTLALTFFYGFPPTLLLPSYYDLILIYSFLYTFSILLKHIHPYSFIEFIEITQIKTPKIIRLIICWIFVLATRIITLKTDINPQHMPWWNFAGRRLQWLYTSDLYMSFVGTNN